MTATRAWRCPECGDLRRTEPLNYGMGHSRVAGSTAKKYRCMGEHVEAYVIDVKKVSAYQRDLSGRLYALMQVPEFGEMP
jgi:hypothetical protein